jgi:hypothetical protein
MDFESITMPALADLLEAATIHLRFDAGPVMTTMGEHPERGHFTVVQTIVGAWLVAERDPYREDAEITGAMVADALQVLRDVKRRAGLVTESLTAAA